MKKNRDDKFYRNLFLINFTCSVTNINLLGIGGMFLTAYAMFLHLDSSQIGKIFSFVALSNILQLISPYVLSKHKSRKKVLIILIIMKYLSYIPIIFIPLIRGSKFSFIGLATFMIISNCFTATIGGGLIDWNDRYVEAQNKGFYYSNRNMIANIIYMISSLVIGTILTSFSNNYIMYLIIFSVMFLVQIFEIAVLFLIPEPKKLNTAKFRLKDMFLPFKDKLFNKYILFTCIWGFSIQMCQPFFIIYSINQMKYSFAFIGMVASITSFAKIFIARPCGLIGDKIGWSKIFRVSGIIYPLTILMWSFLTPSSKILYGIVIFINGISMILINISIFNVLIFLTNSKNRLVYFAVNGSLSAVFNFLGPFIGALIVGRLGTYAIPYININIYKVMFIFTGVVASSVTLYFSHVFGLYEKIIRKTTEIIVQ